MELQLEAVCITYVDISPAAGGAGTAVSTCAGVSRPDYSFPRPSSGRAVSAAIYKTGLGRMALSRIPCRHESARITTKSLSAAGEERAE